MRHADTHLHAHDRLGLERLCRYGARGALVLERMEKREGGKVAYRMKRPLPGGKTHLVLDEMSFLRRVVALIPPARANLVRYHGVFAPTAALRARVVAKARGEEAGREEEQPRVKQPGQAGGKGKKTWAELLKRCFAVEVLRCPACGSARRMLAVLTSQRAIGKILRHLGLEDRPPPRAPARSPQQPTWWESVGA